MNDLNVIDRFLAAFITYITDNEGGGEGHAGHALQRASVAS
ncbi:hypothetical protein [Sphingomonas sp.]|jgi:hypothetical protein